MMLCHYNKFVLPAPPVLVNNSTIWPFPSQKQKPITLCRSGANITVEARVQIQCRPERADGPATILSIGTATPANCVDQTTYADYYFRITNTHHHSTHHQELKNKFQSICENSTIKKRYMHLTEEILKENPDMCGFDAASMDARQKIVLAEVPKLGAEAAEKAIREWGQPKSKITHLIFATTTGVEMPSADYRLTKQLGLSPSVKRFMIYHQGCFAGGTALRMAKDLAENNARARVLVVCSESNAMTFRGPNPARMDSLVAEALFGDGAAAVIVGSDPAAGVERPLFEIVSAAQTIVPETDDAVEGRLGECGMIVGLGRDVPNHIATNIEACLVEAFRPLGISDWDSIFWIAHPGGRAILDKIEAGLGLRPEKLRLSRHVLSDYGNMYSASVLFIMDEMRKSSAAQGLRTTGGEGLDFGVLFGFGPGLTVETVVLRSSIR